MCGNEPTRRGGATTRARPHAYWTFATASIENPPGTDAAATD